MTIVPRSPPRSAQGTRQDDAWAAYAAATADAAPAFDDQLAAFRDIYAGRPADDGPPLAWLPTGDTSAGSNLARILTEYGFEDYASLHRWSVGDPAAFWTMVFEQMGVVFRRSPRAILDRSGGPAHPTWLPGARLHCVDSCFTADRDAVAIRAGREGAADVRTWTCGALDDLANRVANGLAARGLAGRGIALYMPMTPECVAAYLGVLRAGGHVVSIADSFAPPEIRTRIELGGASAVLTVEGYTRAGSWVPIYEKVRAAAAPPAVVIGPEGSPPSGMRRGDLPWDDFLGADTAPAIEAPATPSTTINVLFSSGTTGTPKAIPWTHATPLKCAMDGHFHQDIRPGDTVAWPTNVGWMMGPWLIFAALMNRASIALFEGSPASAAFVRFIETAGVSVLGVIPSLVRAWRTAGAVDDDVWRGVRVFSSTGEASNQADYLWLMSRTRYRAPVIEYLGGTEIGGGHITGTVVQPASPATFTTPALGIDVVLLDDDGRRTAPGADGELYLVPPALGLSQALLNADHDALYYADCPTGPHGEPLRRHGDRMAQLAQGFVAAQGRADDAMNLGGIKVSAREIERVVETDETVRESAAIAVRDPEDGADRLVLFVVPAAPAEAPALRARLAARIAADLNPLFRLHDLVVVAQLPRTASHKIMRRTLRAEYGARAHARPTTP